MPKARKTPSLAILLRLAWRRFQEERCPQIAASLAFTTMLAIVPIITVALTAISVFPVFRELLQYVERFLVRIMLPDSAAMVAGYAAQFAENAAHLTTLGISLIFVTAVLVLLTIDRAFNQIWRVPRPRGLVPRIVVYWALLTVGPPLIGGSLALTSWLVRQSLGLVKGMPLAAEVMLELVPVLLTACAFTLAYVAIPNRRVRMRDALTGGVAAAAAFEATKHGFALFVAHFPTYTLVYGAFASVPIFLLWIYLSWVVVLLGAVTAAVMPEWRERRTAEVLRTG